jgi:hypothetical protein
MKESYYFPHDYNAHEDEKIIKLLRREGHEGYGIYWHLVELVAASSEARLKIEDIEDIAFAMRLDCERIKSIIFDFELFKIDEKFFWSNRLVKFFKEKEKKSEAARKSAKVRWNKENKGYANAMRTQCERNAIKERKGKEIKEKKTYGAHFETFYSAYPKKRKKGDAEKAFKGVAEDVDVLLAAIAKQKKSASWLEDGGKYIPYPASWLRGKCWLDEVKEQPISELSGSDLMNKVFNNKK